MIFSFSAHRVAEKCDACLQAWIFAGFSVATRGERLNK